MSRPDGGYVDLFEVLVAGIVALLVAFVIGLVWRSVADSNERSREFRRVSDACLRADGYLADFEADDEGYVCLSEWKEAGR